MIIDFQEAAIYLAEHVAVETNPGYRLREATIVVLRQSMCDALQRLDAHKAEAAGKALYILDAE